MRGHRQCRLDRNHQEIADTFTALGCTVVSLALLGDGCGDLLVGCNLRNYLVEIKDGTAIPSAQKLTPKEQKFVNSWRGQWCTVYSAKDAIAFVELWRKA